MRPRSATRLFLPLLILALVLGLTVLILSRVSGWFQAPDPDTIASASLQSVREQQRMNVLSARFVAVVTSTQRRFGLTAQKTLITPGVVRYEVDLAQLRQQDLRWNSGTSTLSVTLPPLQVSRPEIDIGQIREYGGNGILTALTNAEQQIDAANRQAAQQQLMQQARDAVTMRLARDSAKRTIARTFAMPLRAAGLNADVEVRFADEPSGDPSYLDRSRRVEEVLEERRKAQ